MDELQQCASVFVVPPHVDDDWCWLYASVAAYSKNPKSHLNTYIEIYGNDNKKQIIKNDHNVGSRSMKPLYVVTNDMIRDHKTAFQSLRVYSRWKGQHLIPYHITTESHGMDIVFHMPGKCNGTYLKKDRFRTVLCVFISDNYSREIQRSANGFWHIPSTDNNAWLCFNLSPL